MATHPDPALVARRAASAASVRAQQIANALADTADLPMLARTSLQAAACAHALARPDEAREALGLALEASLAILDGAAHPQRPLRYRLAGRAAEGPSHLGPGDAHAGTWLASFHAAILLSDQPALDRLAALPLAATLDGPARPAEYLRRWVRVAHTLIAERRLDVEGVLAALEATEPAALPADIVGFVLAVEVPAMALAWRIGAGDAAAADAALAEGLAKHRGHFGRPAEASRPEGFVAWRLSAWKAIAQARGLALATRSPYLFEAASAPAG